MVHKNCFLQSHYRGDRIDGIYDREQQHVVDAAGVVRVSWPGDLLAGGIIDEGRMACDVNLVLCSVRNSIAGAIHVLVLHQCLALLGHHNHVTGNTYIIIIIIIIYFNCTKGVYDSYDRQIVMPTA